MPKFKKEEPKRTPEEVASELGEVYWIWKDGEAEKEELRKEFFKVAADSYSESDLATKTVVLPKDIVMSEDAESYALKYNPGWMFSSFTDDSGDPFKIVLKEDPNLKEWTEVVIVDEGVEDRSGKIHPGYVISKTIIGGSALVDDDRLKNLDPDLWEDVSEYSNWEYFSELANELDKSEEWMKTWLAHKDWPKIIKTNLSSELIEAIKEYSYEGPRSIRLNVRYAKDDETPGA